MMIRLTPKEVESIGRAAKSKGERPSTAAREVIVRWAKRILFYERISPRLVSTERTPLATEIERRPGHS